MVYEDEYITVCNVLFLWSAV